MGRRIELPQLPKGEAQEQLQALYGYLYRMAEALNNNLAEIGNGDFTDEEMTVVREITRQSGTTAEGIPAEAETLKSLIIKTAQLIKSEIDEYNLKLVGTYEADGKLGRYVRKTRLDVDVTPTGIQQNYTFQDIIQGLKTYEVNAKNYIKTGLLRMESSIPVYGVAIGKDVVTFSSDGTETYNDGNKVAELTADELSFWQDGNKVASYTGTDITLYSGATKRMLIDTTGVRMYDGNTLLAKYSGTNIELYSGDNWIQIDPTDGISFFNQIDLLMRIKSGRFSFYYNGNEVFYILNGQIYSAENMEIASGKKIKLNNWYINRTGLYYYDSNNRMIYIGQTTSMPSYAVSALMGELDSVNNCGRTILYASHYDTIADSQLVVECVKKLRNDDPARPYYIGRAYIGGSNTSFGTCDHRIGKIHADAIIADPNSIDPNSTYRNFQIRYYLDQNYDEGKAYDACIDFWYETTDVTKFRIIALYKDPLNPTLHNTASIQTDSTLYLKTVYYQNLIQNSSREIKHDIRDMESKGEQLDRLRPVTFVYDSDPEEKVRAGLIYEETAEVMPEICTGDESSKAINYVEMIPMLLKEIQDLRARVKALEEREGGN